MVLRSSRHLFFLLAFLLAGQTAQADEPAWLPVPPEDLALAEHPTIPGAAAIILYRESHSDDVDSFETHYYRIKVFNEDGRKYADIEIPYWKGTGVKDLKARTIRPDGTVVEFTGQIFEKVLLRVRRTRLLAKTFTLPDVQKGSIIEYRYKLKFDSRRLYDTHWTIQRELSIRKARLSLRPYTGPFRHLQWITQHTSGRSPRMQADGSLLLELENVPAFEKEEFMPPEDWFKMRVDFFYKGGIGGSPQDYWKDIKDALLEIVDKFVKKRDEVHRVVAQTVGPADPPETRLRKLYARAQQIRNLSAEPESARKDSYKENKHVEDVLKRGYGNGLDVNLAFLALARAAGFNARMIWVSTRDRHLFNYQIQDISQLSGHLVEVELNGKPVYLDPATPKCPYGLLTWEQTGVQGLRIAETGDLFVKVPDLTSDQAKTSRKAALTLDSEGVLSGSLEMVYEITEALRRRLEATDEDDAGRRKLLEDDVKAFLPASAEVTLDQVNGWDGSEEPLVAQFRVRIPDLAVPTGRRLLIPLGLFHSTKKNPFDSQQRRYPVYFGFPYEEADEITITLPEGYQVETLPEARTEQSAYGVLELSSQGQEGQLRLRRTLRLNGYFFPVNHYTGLRQFYTAVRARDGEQAVLQVAEAAQR